MQGKREDFRAPGRFSDLARRLDPIQARHSNIHDDDIRSQFLRELARIAPIGRLGANLEIFFRFEQGPNATPDQFVIIDK
jgi:hypothetical protein